MFLFPCCHSSSPTRVFPENKSNCLYDCSCLKALFQNNICEIREGSKIRLNLLEHVHSLSIQPAALLAQPRYWHYFFVAQPMCKDQLDIEVGLHLIHLSNAPIGVVLENDSDLNGCKTIKYTE